MFHINLEKYLELSKSNLYIPLWTEILADFYTPVSVFSKVRELSPYAYLLESVEQNENLGRYSFIGLDPLMVFSSVGRDIKITESNATEKSIRGDSFEELFQVMKHYQPANIPELNSYNGGVVGYFGHDTIRHIEKIPNENPNDLKIPESLFILPGTVFVFDSLEQTLRVIIQTPQGTQKEYETSLKKLDSYLEVLQTPNPAKNIRFLKKSNQSLPQFSGNMTKKEYESVVNQCKKYIYEGDIFQVVISQRFEIEYKKDPFNIYRSLRRINPSPYLFYLQYPDFQIAGSSPEILVKKTGNKLTLRPIAGTIRRGKTPEEDLKLEKQLLEDPKEIAEHEMLVDLGRNDLGRISQFGSIIPTKYKVIENYSHVKHIVTNLESEIMPDTPLDGVLKATFPAGTLSGAPKVRALEIIDEVEVSQRGFYGGMVLNADFHGNLDSCIGIRSVLIKNEKAFIQAGAGIVADSVPENEYEECLNKARAVMRAVQESQEFEESD